MSRSCFLAFLLLVATLVSAPMLAGDAHTGITGKWTISWQARLGKEQGMIELRQKGTELTGVFHGHGDPGSVSGAVKDGNVSFNLEFHGKTPFAIVFTGTLDGDQMKGNFQLQGMKDGYDQHGENVQRTDYLWSAVRLVDAPKHPAQEQKPSR